MCLKPQPPRPMPLDIAAWGAKHLDDDDPYKLTGDTLYEQYHDEDFVDLYHKEGKPALSPVLLAFVTVFQNLENLSDRKAAEAVECNLKWLWLKSRLQHLAMHQSPCTVQRIFLGVPLCPSFPDT